MRMTQAEVLYFNAELWDAARKSGTNTEHQGNVIVFVLAYKIKYTCFDYFCPPLPAKPQKKLNLPKGLLAKLQPFFVNVTTIVLTHVLS